VSILDNHGRRLLSQSCHVPVIGPFIQVWHGKRQLKQATTRDEKVNGAIDLANGIVNMPKMTIDSWIFLAHTPGIARYMPAAHLGGIIHAVGYAHGLTAITDGIRDIYHARATPENPLGNTRMRLVGALKAGLAGGAMVAGSLLGTLYGHHHHLPSFFGLGVDNWVTAAGAGIYAGLILWLDKAAFAGLASKAYHQWKNLTLTSKISVVGGAGLMVAGAVTHHPALMAAGAVIATTPIVYEHRRAIGHAARHDSAVSSHT